MDDFGSGYSSLNMLKEAPVDEIKLDMRFLSAADPYGRAEEILHMIITMGNHMKLSIIAEGVETEQQKVMLQGFGCNKAQGYFYARPMREAEYTELLRKEKAENKKRIYRSFYALDFKQTKEIVYEILAEDIRRPII